MRHLVLAMLAIGIAAAADQAPAPKVADSAAAMTKEYDRLESERRAAELKLVGDWMARAKLRPVPVPVLGADPRQSERDAAARAATVNTTIADLQAAVDSKKIENVDAVLRRIGPDFWKLYDAAQKP